MTYIGALFVWVPLLLPSCTPSHGTTDCAKWLKGSHTSTDSLETICLFTQYGNSAYEADDATDSITLRFKIGMDFEYAAGTRIFLKGNGRLKMDNNDQKADQNHL